MKIKKIIELIKKNKNLVIYEGKNCDWLSDGAGAIYPALKSKDITADIICDMYDISPSDITIRNTVLPTALDYADCCECENQVEHNSIAIVCGGKQLIPYDTSQGIAFIDKKYLAPFADIDEDYLNVFERYTADGDLYFAVKNGFELIGIIMPVKVVNDDFVEKINAFARACNVALQNKKCEEV